MVEMESKLMMNLMMEILNQVQMKRSCYGRLQLLKR